MDMDGVLGVGKLRHISTALYCDSRRALQFGIRFAPLRNSIFHDTTLATLFPNHHRPAGGLFCSRHPEATVAGA